MGKKIVLFGYGRMGKEIEKIAIERGHEVCLTVDIDNINTITKEDLAQADVAIDFSIPGSAYSNVMKCFDADLPIVVGTTGWNSKIPEVNEYCLKNNKTFFFASNYSVGVNILGEINMRLARLMNSLKDYDVQMTEIHHTKKLDSPSGTAITLAEQILDNLDRKNKWVEKYDRQENELVINAVREGNVPGTHSIKYVSDIDDIEISHKAHGRKGFAMGAVLAAEFIADKKGVYGMSDLLDLK